jgi:glucosyl-3-phosphoglycerate synthase
MPDFHQPILLPTLHHLAETKLEEREGLLKELSLERPIALVIPALYSELEGEALPRMLQHLAKVNYVSQVVFSMNGMTKAQHTRAKQIYARRLPKLNHTILWNDGPALNALHHKVDAATGMKHTHGKGSNVWMGLMHLLANDHRGVVVCHDSDILNYDRAMLWRLCLPVTHPGMGYLFAKSYYGRVRERMYGRVTRLLIFPLLQALREVLGSTPLLRFLAMFRYPLSGEFAADSEFIKRVGMASDWGLEIGMLCDVFRQAPAEKVCQVDLGGNFEHKHQHLDYDSESGRSDARSGLVRMAREVTRALLAHLWSDLGFSPEQRKLERLTEAYTATALVLLARYSHEATFNGLEQSTNEEKKAIMVFAGMISQVAKDCMTTPPTATRLPSWAALSKLMPDFQQQLSRTMKA